MHHFSWIPLYRIRAFEKARCTRIFLNVDLAHLQNASENNVFKSFVDNRWQQARNLKIVCFFVLLFLEPYKPELITSCNKCRGAGFKTALHVYLERQVRNHMRREGHKSQILFIDMIKHCWHHSKTKGFWKQRSSYLLNLINKNNTLYKIRLIKQDFTPYRIRTAISIFGRKPEKRHSIE